MRLILLVFLYLCSCSCYCRSVSLNPYEIVNDTIIQLLDNYVFINEKDYYKKRKITLSISKKDSLVWIYTRISIEKGVSLFCERLEEAPLGYVQYKDMKIIVWSDLIQGFFEPKSDLQIYQVPCSPKNDLPVVDGVREWIFAIDQNQNKVYKLDYQGASMIQDLSFATPSNHTGLSLCEFPCEFGDEKTSDF